MSLVMYRLYLSRSKDMVVLLYAVLIRSVAVVIENRHCIDFIACHQPERVQGGFHVAVTPEFRVAISSLMPRKCRCIIFYLILHQKKIFCFSGIHAPQI